MSQQLPPVSGSAFIQLNQPTLRAIPLTTTTKTGKAKMTKTKKTRQVAAKKSSATPKNKTVLGVNNTSDV
jgi:hypothetical protein